MKLLKTVLLTLLTCSTLFAAEEDLETFQVVWETIKEKHWDLKSTGVDWDEVYTTYKPRMAEAENRTEARRILTEMLGELKQSHFRIMEAESGDKVEDLRARYSGQGTPGFQVTLIENRPFIVKIDPESEAFRQGLGIGTEIVAVRDEPVSGKIAEILKVFKDELHKDVYIPKVINGMMGGQPGESISLQVRIDGKQRDVKLPLVKAKGQYMNLMNLSGLFFRYESLILPGNVAYVSFNMFLPDAGTRFVEDLKGKFAESDGLIIDLRGNPGGMGILAVPLANRLITAKGKRLGQMINAGGTMNFSIFPQKPHYDKPVAVLVDGGSASTSEILAAGLQDLERARVFGTPTAGAVLPSIIVDLPNGDRFQYAIGDYLSFKGHHLEGVGVIPDEKTPHTLKTMVKKVDAPLDAASHWIKNQKTGVTHETF